MTTLPLAMPWHWPWASSHCCCFALFFVSLSFLLLFCFAHLDSDPSCLFLNDPHLSRASYYLRTLGQVLPLQFTCHRPRVISIIHPQCLRDGDQPLCAFTGHSFRSYTIDSVCRNLVHRQLSLL